MRKRLLSLTLALVMALVLIPTSAFAQEEVTLSREEMLTRIPALSVHRPQNFLEAEYATCIDVSPLWEGGPSAAEMEAIFQEIASLTDGLVSGKASDTEKVKAIYQWVSSNISYGDVFSNSDPFDGLFAYSSRYAICEGYSRLCLLMLNLSGLPGVLVVNDDLAHMWNAAYVDGQWITFDATQRKWGDSRHIEEILYYDNSLVLTLFDKGNISCRLACDDKDACPATLVIPDGVTELWFQAFSSCKNLTSVVIPGSMTEIGEYAFAGCENLTSVVISDGVTKIGYGAFNACDSLTDIVIPDSVTEIRGAFSYCRNLASVFLPAGIKKADFPYCRSLPDIYYAGSEEQWKAVAFTWDDGDSRGHFEAISKSIKTETREKRTFLLIGEGEMDITDILKQEGTFHYEGDGFLLDIDMVDLDDETALSDDVKSALKQLGAEYSLTQRITAGKRKYPGQVHYNCQPPAVSVEPSAAPTAYASTQSVLVDGSPVEFQAYALKDENGNDTNYIKLRDVAQVLNGSSVQFNVGWDGAVNIERGKAYVSNGSEMSTPFSGNRTYETATAPTNIDGRAADLEAILLKDDAGGAYTYYKLRDLGAALGFLVDWSPEKGIFIETK